jgi:hypothetical protein
MRLTTRISRSILAIGLGSLAFAAPAFAHGDTPANPAVLGPQTAQATQVGPNADQRGPGIAVAGSTTQVGPNADQRGPGIAIAGSTTQVGPNADQRGPGIDPASVSTALPSSAATSEDSGISVLALLLSLAGMGVVAAGGVALVSSRGHRQGHGAGTA